MSSFPTKTLKTGSLILLLILLLSPSFGWVQGSLNSVPKSSTGTSSKWKEEESGLLKAYMEEMREELQTIKSQLIRVTRNTKVLRSALRDMRAEKCGEQTNDYGNANCPYGFDVSTPTSCYKFMPERVTWHEAQARCSAIRAHLVSLESDSEQRFVSKHLSDMRKLRNCDVWTGGTDVRVEGVWKWNHTGNIVVTSHWYNGEPNNSNGSEDCAWMDWYFSWAWNDASCERDKACFVCEVDI